jgi:hypothetical protein
MTLPIFILTYIAVTIGSRYTALDQYQWFRRLELWLLFKYPAREKLITDIFSFKLFHCTPCQSFWLSVPIFSYFFTEPTSIIFALLTYLIKIQDDGAINNKD